MKIVELFGYKDSLLNVWVATDVENQDIGWQEIMVFLKQRSSSNTCNSSVDAAQDAWDDNNVEGESSAEKITRIGA